MIQHDLNHTKWKETIMEKAWDYNKNVYPAYRESNKLNYHL